MKFSLPLLCAAAGFTLVHGAIAADISDDDQRFLRKAGESGLLEIQASKLALERATHPEVKRYAEMMIKDHSAVDEELKALATTKGFQLPVELDGGKRRLMEDLRQLEGAGFDEEYIDEVAVDAHEEAVELFEDAADDAKDAEIKAFAAKHLPALQGHLDMGRKLEDVVDDADDDARRDKPAVPEATPQSPAAVPGTGVGPSGR